jgi:uncharacterized protein (TIGR00730 family)
MATKWEKLKASVSIFFNLSKVTWQATFGVWKLLSMPQPMVSVFGGSRIEKENAYAQQAVKLGQMLVERGISVITGGGAGIMEAISRGISESGKGQSIGISITGLEDKNPFVTQYFTFGYLFARKWLLTRYSKAYIIFPGGFGTLDELAEVLTLIQTKQVPKIPIVLVGIDYWKDFMEWVKDAALKHGLITTEELALFIITDDLEEVVHIVCAECKIQKS